MTTELFSYDLSLRNEEEAFNLICGLVEAYGNDTNQVDYTEAVETWLTDPVDTMVTDLQVTLEGHYPKGNPVVIVESGWLTATLDG